MNLVLDLTKILHTESHNICLVDTETRLSTSTKILNRRTKICPLFNYEKN